MRLRVIPILTAAYFGVILAASAQDIPSPSVLAVYAQQYRGFGFDETTIRILAAAKLQVNDFRSLARKYGQTEVIRGARNAVELDMTGRDQVEDVTCISETEVSLYKRLKPGNSEEENKRIIDQIHALPPKRCGPR
jgi:hypothetical protein